MKQNELEQKAKCIHFKKEKGYFWETYCAYCDGYGNIEYPDDEVHFVKRGICGKYSPEK